MADQADVRRIALSLPGTVEGQGHFAFSVIDKGKARGFAWVWMERLAPKKPRIANPAVLAVRVDGAVEKELLLASDDEKFFTEPHYNGFPAVLVRLAAVDDGELEALLTGAWRCLAPKAATTEKPAAKKPAAKKPAATKKPAAKKPAAPKPRARSR